MTNELYKNDITITVSIENVFELISSSLFNAKYSYDKKELFLSRDSLYRIVSLSGSLIKKLMDEEENSKINLR